jgi:hypothetical protein
MLTDVSAFTVIRRLSRTVTALCHQTCSDRCRIRMSELNYSLEPFAILKIASIPLHCSSGVCDSLLRIPDSLKCLGGVKTRHPTT